MIRTTKPAKRGATHRPSESRRTFRVPRAAEILASHLRNQIIRGVLKEGDRLPKEQDLIEQFGVARSTFREAYVILEADGLISVSRGARKGAVVHRPSVQAAARQMTFLMQSRNVTLDDIYGSLCAFEPVAIRLLAQKANRNDVAALRAQIDEMRQAVQDDHAFSEVCARFRRTLVERSGLVSMALIIELMANLVESYMETTARAMPPGENKAGKLKSIRVREQLVSLLEKNDADAAESLWQKFLEATRELNLYWQPGKAVQDIYPVRYPSPKGVTRAAR
jgi:DNA-binding FadR family transcriptional regulator